MKLTILKAAIFGVLSLLILGLNEASAATCTIQGQNLVVAYSKARSNGYTFSCRSVNDKFYSMPGKLGCRANMTVGSPLPIFMFNRKTLAHGWRISNFQARGGPGGISKKIAPKYIKITARPTIGRKHNYYVTKIYLKHSSKGCGNIQSVLTDAFGQ